MEDTQKLSTIVFGDIKGYTALMQEDEANAMALLKIFKGRLEEIVPSFGGQIVQYFGDACLLSFESTSQAVRCTLKLQPIFREKQVPVRFGIHLGEVIFTENNVFGDGVNVASRIESMGVAGGILVSKTVKEQIANKPEFSLKSMGSFDFKNVEEPLEVYAITNEGIVVPQREELQGKFKPAKRRPIRQKLILAAIALLVAVTGIWFLRPGSSPLTEDQHNSYLAILPFENETNRAGLDGFGPMVSDWLTSVLMETGGAKIVGAENLKNEVAEAGFATPEVAELFAENGIGLLITGRYYIQDDQLYVQANIVDTRTGLIVHAPSPVVRQQTDKSEILEVLSQEILGFWQVRNLDRFRKDPPSYEAYREYLAGEYDFGVGLSQEDLDYLLRAEAHYLKAYELDTSFMTPLLQLHVTYHNMRRYRKKDSLFHFLEAKKNSMTIWERKNFEFEWERTNGTWIEAARIAQEMFEMDPTHELSASRAMSAYVFSNHPREALALLSKWDSLLVEEEEPWFRAVPLYMLREFDSIYAIYNREIQKNLEDPWDWFYSMTLIQTGRYEELKPLLAASEGGMSGFPSTFDRICNTLVLKGNDSLARIFASRYKEYALAHQDKSAYLQWLGSAEMYLGNYKEAARHLESQLESEIAPGPVIDLIACYAHLGATGKIDNLITNLPRIYKPDAYRSYLRAVAQTILGNHDQAIEQVAAAIREGVAFDATTFAFDHHFMPLFDDSRFQRLVEPKG